MEARLLRGETGEPMIGRIVAIVDELMRWAVLKTNYELEHKTY